MAVKGKRKSQSRGSQGRRRPATAPRMAVSHQPKEPWYNSSGGRVGIAIGIVLAIAIVAAVIVNSGNEAPVDAARREGLQDYTAGLRAAGLEVSGPAQEMAAVKPDPSAKNLDDLSSDAKTWTEELGRATAAVAPLASNPSTADITQVFQQSTAEFLSAAEFYGLAAQSEEKLRDDLLSQASGALSRAATLWQTGLNLLEAERADAGLSPANLQPPTTPQLGAPPEGG